jgi:hypothetical protein
MSEANPHQNDVQLHLVFSAPAAEAGEEERDRELWASAVAAAVQEALGRPGALPLRDGGQIRLAVCHVCTERDQAALTGPAAPDGEGYWRVDGTTRRAVVRAGSAAEAIRLALAEGAVREIDCPTTRCLGPQLPRVVRL